MIVADTGAVLALIDAADQHHEEVVELYEESGEDWVLPWAILPEVDYLLLAHVGAKAETAFVRDVARAAFVVEWNGDLDIPRAHQLCEKYHSLGLVDGTVIAVAERLRAQAIVTFDLRHFGAIAIKGSPKLLPRDL